MTTLLSSKGPAETVVVTLNFANELPSGVTLASIVGTLTVTALLGSDSSPSSILSGSAQLNSANTVVLQQVLAGVDGECYRISATCLCSDGETMTVSAVVPVQTQ